MSNRYVIGIDETGGFEKRYKGKVVADKEKASRVGGIVLKNPRERAVHKCLDATRQGWNRDHPQAHVARNEHFHYFPLRGVSPWGNASDAPNLSKEEGAALTNLAVTALTGLPEFLLAFSSAGFPPFFVDEQQAYVEILRTTLWGLLSQKLPLVAGDEVAVVIAPRGQVDGVYSSWKPKERRLYFRLLMEQLQSEFGNLALDRQCQIGFETAEEKVFQSSEIMAADLLLGNEKTKDVALQYCKLRFDDYYRLTVGIDPIEEVVAAYERGDCPSLAAFNQLLYLYALECRKDKKQARPALEKLKKIMDEIAEHESLLDEATALFNTTVQTLLNERAETARNMELAEIYCLAMLQMYPLAQATVRPVLMRLQEVALRHLIGIESHKGEVGNDEATKAGEYIKTYREFFERNKERLYPTIGERIMNRLEMELRAIQVSHFNNYNFAEAEDILTSHYIQYQSTYADFLANGEKDALFGKLCGTLGQANGFLYAIRKDQASYTAAARQLKEDSDNFIRDTQQWSIGMHYRVHLELCRQDQQTGPNLEPLAVALDLLRLLWNDPKLEPDTLLARVLADGSVFDLSLAMKFLTYYRKSHADFAVPTKDLETLILKAASNKWPWYPACHVLKWACCIALLSKNPGLAGNAISLVPPLPEPNFTLQTLEIPILMLKAYLKSKDSKPIVEKLDQLMAQQPGFKKCLRLSGWPQKFPAQTMKNWELWDIVTLLPFYYC